eukprot:CAMPEP_0195539556 /NCGR_PEP_ID=MMETSP0794_2-20130614/50115_1 /TAXON_ID=515487 /ORGANISM="Stephanopyxis turris, Strain CCMP 815" /LENGTH=704 /DNA_ID=CAMNT_0040673593 /DNA_START=269 /DNA_END=2383 /DNA_ORIENTATION=-
MKELADKYPDLVTLKSSQEMYGLPTAGNSNDCPFEAESGCKNWILTIEDSVSHPTGSGSYKELPEILLSGALHGDERVGPTVVVETAVLMLDSANCEAERDESRRQSCMSDLGNRGIDDFERQWLAFCVASRRIIVLPTANALGYFRGQRMEGNYDPNRDFPFDLRDYSTCMRTVAGRTINEIFRDHLIQLSFTYHAGMESIAYEWGNPTYYDGSKSPDDVAQNEISRGFSDFGGSFQTSPVYKYGDMNALVYPVRGGMEDWAYAASWDTSLTKPCTPSSVNGQYAPEKTTYGPSTLRAFNILVETSDRKTPNWNTLGTTEDVFNPQSQGNGHISRNIKLATMMVDVVQPYTRLLAVEDAALPNDIVPERVHLSCVENDAVNVSQEKKVVQIKWTVGGGFSVDETSLVYGKWTDFAGKIKCFSQPTQERLNTLLATETIKQTSTQTGRTRWHQDGATPIGGSDFPPGPIFSAAVDLNDFEGGDTIAVFAVAKLDQSWKEQPNSFAPNVPPQSHVVNARTNPDWYHTSESGMIVQGRQHWVSVPVTLVIADDDEAPSTPTEPISPVTSAPVTSAPVTSPPVTSSPVTSSPVTSPPVTSPPVTSPPVTSPPVTSPPVTSPPVTSPPVTSAPTPSQFPSTPNGCVPFSEDTESFREFLRQKFVVPCINSKCFTGRSGRERDCDWVNESKSKRCPYHNMKCPVTCGAC